MEGKWQGTFDSATLCECICALHLSSYVESPFTDRGGLILVGPPGVLKTTFLDVLDDNYSTALSYSNLNTMTLSKMQSGFVNGAVRTLVFPDMQALYAGDPRTASRLEQGIMQLSGESRRGASWEDSRFQKFRGRATIFGAMTSDLYEQKSPEWDRNGFARRFLWATYTLRDPDILTRSIEEWKRADIGRLIIPPVPLNGSIPDCLTKAERHEVLTWLKYQPSPHEIQLQLLCKAVSVLKWHYRERGITNRKPMDVMQCFAECLQRDAALLDLSGSVPTPELVTKPKRRRSA